MKFEMSNMGFPFFHKTGVYCFFYQLCSKTAIMPQLVFLFFVQTYLLSHGMSFRELHKNKPALLVKCVVEGRCHFTRLVRIFVHLSFGYLYIRSGYPGYRIQLYFSPFCLCLYLFNSLPPLITPVNLDIVCQPEHQPIHVHLSSTCQFNRRLFSSNFLYANHILFCGFSLLLENLLRFHQKASSRIISTCSLYPGMTLVHSFCRDIWQSYMFCSVTGSVVLSPPITDRKIDISTAIPVTTITFQLSLVDGLFAPKARQIERVVFLLRQRVSMFALLRKIKHSSNYDSVCRNDT